MDNWNTPKNNSSKTTWAEYFFDNPECEDSSSKNSFFLNNFYSVTKNNDRDTVVNLLKHEDLITKFRNLTNYFSNLIPNAAFNCPGFAVNGPQPLLTIGRVTAVNGRFGSSIIILVYYQSNNQHNVAEGFHLYAKKLGEENYQNQFIRDQYTPANYPGAPYQRLMQSFQFDNNKRPNGLSPHCQEALHSICGTLETQINKFGHTNRFSERKRPDGIPNRSPIYPKFIREPGPVPDRFRRR